MRRGDFMMRRAFDKEIFFELFGIGSKEVTLYYEDLDRRTLLKQAEGLVTGDLKAALDRGQFASLRVYGELGMPHNVLLLAHGNGFYHFHDPTTGTIRRATAAGLAARMLTESKKGDGQIEEALLFQLSSGVAGRCGAQRESSAAARPVARLAGA